MGVHVLRRVEEDPGTIVQRIAPAEGITITVVWRIFHEQSLPYHIQQRQAFTSHDQCARVVFSQWLLGKCFVNTACS
jgi:hypothetical protein